MAKVTLQFPDLVQLNKFRLTLRYNHPELNVAKFTINSHCTTEEIKEAIIYYKAQLLTLKSS